MKHVHILCIATETIYTEVINSFKSYFRSMGYFVSYECAFKTEPKVPYSEDINIVIKAQRHFDPNTLPKESIKILFQSEQYEKLREFNSMPYSKKWDLILDVFKNNVDLSYKKSFGKIEFFPIGYDSEYQLLDDCEFQGIKSKYNAYFFGARTKYRVGLWNKHVNGKIHSVRFANQDHDFTKYANIIKSKVNIFIPGWEPYYLPTMHIMQILANRKFLLVVSDTPQDFYPYESGRHFALTSSTEFGSMLQRFIIDERFRDAFERTMYDDIIANHKFSDYLDEALTGYL